MDGRSSASAFAILKPIHPRRRRGDGGCAAAALVSRHRGYILGGSNAMS